MSNFKQRELQHFYLVPRKIRNDGKIQIDLTNRSIFDYWVYIPELINEVLDFHVSFRGPDSPIRFTPITVDMAIDRRTSYSSIRSKRSFQHFCDVFRDYVFRHFYNVIHSKYLCFYELYVDKMLDTQQYLELK